MLKNYLLEIICACSDEQTGQDAVEWAVISGMVELTGNREADLRAIMGKDNYSRIIVAYQQHLAMESQFSQFISQLQRAA